MWQVLPLIMPHRGDMRRNYQPYYIGQGCSWSEYNQALSCKQTLTARGIACYVSICSDPRNTPSQ
jgi:hypothetical protein